MAEWTEDEPVTFESDDRAEPRRRPHRRLLVVASLIAVVAAAAATLYVVEQEPSGPHSKVAGRTPPLLGYDPRYGSDYAQRAAAGYAHVVYAKSPDGALATAQRVAAFRPLVEQAAAGSGVSPDLVEGMIFLESAGRPDVVAGSDAASAAGLGQILAETAQNLLGMHVDLAASRRLTHQIAAATAAGDAGRVSELQAERRTADDRFTPALAVAGTVRYLDLALQKFGRSDLAVESYHMGMGNLDGVLRAFTGDQSSETAAMVRGNDLSYTRLFFGSSPVAHPEAYRKLTRFGDDSATYLWRVLAAVEIMHLYRTDRAALESTAQLQTAAPTAELALHPSAQRAGDGLVTLADDPAKTGYGLSPALPTDARRLQPPAAATLTELAGVVRRIAPGAQPLEVSSALGTSGMDATGYRFTIARHYSPGGEAAAFQFTLDRLQALNRIAWQRMPGVIAITAAG
jgi:soluble lytic murein transglycosylase-like protein